MKSMRRPQLTGRCRQQGTILSPQIPPYLGKFSTPFIVGVPPYKQNSSLTVEPTTTWSTATP
jgi:hypothetical protein